MNPDIKIPVGRDYYRTLIGGYKICKASGSEICIADPSGSLIITATIDQYSHDKGMIFGNVINEKKLPEYKYDKPGYFIINAEKGYVSKGLTFDVWLKELQSYGVSNFKLRDP